MENVVGLVTHKCGLTLEAIQECFRQVGYETDWRVVNAANFGIPPKRERFILIGVEWGARIVFPSPTHRFTGKTIGVRDRSRIITAPDNNSVFQNLPKALTAWDSISDLPPVAAGEEATFYKTPPKNEYQQDRRRLSSKLTLHKATGHTPRMMEIIRYSGENIKSIPSSLITSGFSSCYSRLSPNEPSVTITVNFVHPASNKCIHPFQDRALTPREGARLQSFDDYFWFAGNRSQIVKQIGNAVPPLLGTAVARAVAKILGIEDHSTCTHHGNLVWDSVGHLRVHGSAMDSSANRSSLGDQQVKVILR